MSRKKNLPAPFGAIPGNFLRGPGNLEKCQFFAYLPWWANGPYSPGVGCYGGLPEAISENFSDSPLAYLDHASQL